MVVSGTTLRVVEGLFAEMREQPGGSAQDVAMRRTKDGERRTKKCVGRKITRTKDWQNMEGEDNRWVLGVRL